MAYQIFHNPYGNVPAKIWNSQGGIVQWGYTTAGQGESAMSDKGKFACLDQISIQFDRPMTTVYPVAGEKRIKFLGAPNGTVTLRTVMGPDLDLQEFFKASANACDPLALRLTPSDRNTTCGTSNKQFTIQLYNCVSTRVNYQLQSTQTGMSIAYMPIVMTFDHMTFAQKTV